MPARAVVGPPLYVTQVVMSAKMGFVVNKPATIRGVMQ